MSTNHIQQGISQFVDKSKAVGPTSPSENTGNRTSTTSSTSNLKKRIKVHIAQVQKSHLTKDKPPNRVSRRQWKPTITKTASFQV